MRIWRLCGLVLGGLLLLTDLNPASADSNVEARQLTEAREYDLAIEMLGRLIASGNADAESYNQLGVAYHWKKDYENALKNYRQAARLDKAYLTSPLPMLAHFKLYDEIVHIGETALSRGDASPGILSGLLNAYFATGNSSEYQRVLGVLRTQTYDHPYDADYRRYLLAKAEVRAGNHEKAFTHISAMTTRSLLQYMAGSEDFAAIAHDPRFVEMTR